MVGKYLPVMMMAATLMAQNPDDMERHIKEVVVMGRGGSYLGVGISEIGTDRAKELNLREERGVELTMVDEDSPASKAGLKKGDVVLEYQGQRIEGKEQFIRMVRETPPGRNVKMTISRNGSIQNLTATIGTRKVKAMGPATGFQFQVPEMPEMRMPDMPNAFLSWRSGMLGVEAESLSPQLAEYFGVKEGVLVRSVGKGTAAEKAGLKAGDIIQKVDDQKVTSPMEVTRAIRSVEGRKNLQLVVVRERKEITVPVTIEEAPRGERMVPKARSIRAQDQDF